MVKMVGSGSFTTWCRYVDIDSIDTDKDKWYRYSIDHLGPAPGLGRLLLLQQRHEVLYRLLAHGHALLVAAGVLRVALSGAPVLYWCRIVIIKLYLEHTATECYIPWSFAGLVYPAAPCNMALSEWYSGCAVSTLGDSSREAECWSGCCRSLRKLKKKKSFKEIIIVIFNRISASVPYPDFN